MKAMLLQLSTFAAVASLALVANAADYATLLKEAQDKYAQREFSAQGIDLSKQAADKYAEAAAAAGDDVQKATALIGQSDALYFYANASTDTKIKVDFHLKGMEVADQALKLIGIADVSKIADADIQKLKTSANKDLLAKGLYLRGTNLGQWGSANGVMDSLSKWPDLRRNMEVLEILDVTAESYGAFRVLGRGYFKIPSLLGGSAKKAEKYLTTAVQKTLVPGTTISKQGYNNIYLAEVLKEQGEDDKAVELLEAFLAADPAQVDATQIPELKQAQREAQELLKSW